MTKHKMYGGNLSRKGDMQADMTNPKRIQNTSRNGKMQTETAIHEKNSKTQAETAKCKVNWQKAS